MKTSSEATAPPVGARIVMERMIHTIEFFPDGRPAPPVLTEDEAISLLRLDEAHPDAAGAHRALRRIVETGRIRPIRIGRVNRFARDEIVRFIRHSTEAVSESSASNVLFNDLLQQMKTR